MQELHNTISIDAPAATVWRIVGDLMAPGAWIPGIANAKLEGLRRVCTTADGNEIHEEITEYSQVARSFSYRQDKGPMPVKNSSGTMTVEENGSGARVVWDTQFEALDPSKAEEIAGMIDGYYKQTLEALRAKVEGA